MIGEARLLRISRHTLASAMTAMLLLMPTPAMSKATAADISSAAAAVSPSAGSLSSQSELKPYGFDLFANAPTDFSVPPGQPVPSDYRLGAGDKLAVRYWTPAIPEIACEAYISRDGVFNLPGVGDIAAGGLTQAELRKKLGARLQERFRDPSFTIELVAPRTLVVFVTGAARRPGRYTVSALSGLFNVIYAAGGPSEKGSMRSVSLKRGKSTVAVMDIYKFLLEGTRDADMPLQDQDVIHFPAAGPRVSLSGQVANPALYEITATTRLADLISMAGGLSASANRRIVRLQRIEGGSRVELTVDAAAIASTPAHKDNLLLRDGDFLTVESVVGQVFQRVEASGKVEYPGSYSIQRTPTVKALLTAAGISIGAYRERADLMRTLDDGTPVIIPIPLRRLLEGNAADIPLIDQDRVVVYGSDDKIIIPLVNIEGPVKHPAVFRLTAGMTAADLIFTAGGMLKEAAPQIAHLYRRIGPERLKIMRLAPAGILQEGATGNIRLQDGDRLVLYRQRDVEYTPDKVRIVGEVQRPGEYTVCEGMTLYDLIIQAGGPTDMASGTVEIARPLDIRADGRETEVRISSVTALAGGGDEPLAAGMLISLPGRGDRLVSPRKVEIKGRVQRPGVYALLYDEETLASVLRRAGGLAQNADPFGISLTRQRERLQTAVTAEQIKTVLASMDQLLPPAVEDAAKASEKSAVAMDAEDPMTTLAGLSGRRTFDKVLLVSPRRLSEVPVSNRITFKLEDKQSYVDRLGLVKLADGDCIEIPATSEVVQVLGAVRSPGPLFCRTGYTAGDFVSQAGGGAPDADISRSVVIKATGAVEPLKLSARMDPGDVIVIASRYQVIQPQRKRTLSDILLDIMGVALVVRGLE